MGNVSKIAKLDLQLQMQINDCIRAHSYIQIDVILRALKELGFEGIHRSNLHCYIVKLKAQDALTANPNEGTVITIVERATGEVRVIKSSASAVAIASMIAKINVPPNIS
jgi:hypothetical protein